MRNQSNPARQAFTMLELVAVLVMLGLISAFGMFAVSGQLDQARLSHLAQSIANADRKERDASRKSPTAGSLTFDKSMRRLRYENSVHTIDLKDNLKIAELIIGSGKSNERSVVFSHAGQSSTYALRLESKRGAMNWIVVIGMTGQVLFSDDSNQVRSLLALGG
jgi:prepilin-type N-terminal cleavage/methylation domain-containing protein